MPVTNGVAVVADNFWRAKEALQAMPVEWDFGPAGSTDSAQFAADIVLRSTGRSLTGGGHGDIDAAFSKPVKTVEALYEVPYLAHAPMEPLNATAHWQGDRIDVWMGTQAPELALAFAAKAGGVDPKAVFVHNCFLGGGFGRRAVNDELTQAVEVSKALKRPIKVIWTREEDIRSDRYRPQAALRMRAALRERRRGRGLRLHHRGRLDHPLARLGQGSRTGSSARRSKGSPIVPIERCAQGRRQPQEHPCAGHVLALGRLVTERVCGRELHRRMRPCGEARSGRVPARAARGQARFPCRARHARGEGRLGKPLPKGVGRGVAIHEAFGTIVGEIAEVAVSKSGEVKVQRVIACVDCGHLVNPLTATMQIESAVLYGLTAALFGEITIKQGRVEQGNFDAYPIARMADAPVIETHFVLSGGDKWGGLGEPGTPPIAPAIANAVFAVTGKRIRSLPLRNASLGV